MRMVLVLSSLGRDLRRRLWRCDRSYGDVILMATAYETVQSPPCERRVDRGSRLSERPRSQRGLHYQHVT
jgi:hypothetical protein